MSADNNKAPAGAGGEGRQAQLTLFGFGSKGYSVQYLNRTEVKPSPENATVYDKITAYTDPDIWKLIESIKDNGLAEPLIVSADGFIMSGHRRFAALRYLKMETIPCRRMKIRREGHPNWHRVLTTFNTQRRKSVSTTIKEELITEDPAETKSKMEALKKKEMERIYGHSEVMEEPDEKTSRTISNGRMPFLRAVQKAVEEEREFWPSGVRRYHYRLLNNPPLKLTPETSTKDSEASRYMNDLPSYKALSRLCDDGRYSGHLPMDAFEDSTRQSIVKRGYTNVAEFIEQETENLFLGYHRHLSQSQPHHVECVVEKNTVMGIARPICERYYIPLTPSRGYISIPALCEMEKRWRDSGKEQMVLLMISDFDCEGLDLTRDIVARLRDKHGVPVTGIRVGVTKAQIEKFGLVPNFAKETSSRYRAFIKETGSTDTFEVEAMPPKELQAALEASIQEVFDMDLFNAEVKMQNEEIPQLTAARNAALRNL